MSDGDIEHEILVEVMGQAADNTWNAMTSYIAEQRDVDSQEIVDYQRQLDDYYEREYWSQGKEFPRHRPGGNFFITPYSEDQRIGAFAYDRSQDAINAAQALPINVRLRIGKESKKTFKKLNRVMKQIEYATPQAAAWAVLPIFEESQNLVPTDSGALKESAYIKTTDAGRKRVRVEIGYAEHGHPEYAWYVHEQITHQHAYPTQAKFLETAAALHLQEIPERAKFFMTGIVNSAAQAQSMARFQDAFQRVNAKARKRWESVLGHRDLTQHQPDPGLDYRFDVQTVATRVEGHIEAIGSELEKERALFAAKAKGGGLDQTIYGQSVFQHIPAANDEIRHAFFARRKYEMSVAKAGHIRELSTRFGSLEDAERIYTNLVENEVSKEFEDRYSQYLEFQQRMVTQAARRAERVAIAHRNRIVRQVYANRGERVPPEALWKPK